MILKEIFNLIFKIILVLLVLVIIAAGVVCSAELYRIKTAESITVGEITEHDPWEDFNIFNCDLSNAIFYKTATGYEYQETVPQAISFNGTQNKYNVLLNNTPCINETSTAGILNAQNIINYYSIYGQVIQQTTLNIEIRFYQSEIEINISNTNNDVEQSYFMEYLRFKGLHLQIIEAQYTIQSPEIQTYTVAFVNGINGENIAVQTYNRGARLVAPKAPNMAGYVFIGWSPTLPEYVNSNLIFTANYANNSTTGVNLLPEPIEFNGYDRSYRIEGLTNYDYKITANLYFGEQLVGEYAFTTQQELRGDLSYASGGINISYSNTDYYDVTANLRLGAISVYEDDQIKYLSISFSVSQTEANLGFGIGAFMREFTIEVTSIVAI